MLPNDFLSILKEKNFFLRIKNLQESINKNKKLKELKDFKSLINAPNFWDNHSNAQKVLEKVKNLESLIEKINSLELTLSDIETLIQLQTEESSSKLNDEIIHSIKLLEKNLNSMELINYFKGVYDKNNCFLTINSGAGGTESCDWANMLYRMYLRWIEKSNLKYKLWEIQNGDITGIKSCLIYVEGDYAYGKLKAERGTHRLVRLSPFDSNQRRHTSFASIDIYPDLPKEKVDIKLKDLRIDTFKASGSGGQHVNTTDSAIRITHLPSKIVVSCQMERSQHQNKETAMKMLASKLEVLKEEKQNKILQSNNIQKGDNAWGNQIRSYVLHPYKMVKDLRTQYQTSSINAVLDGELDPFIESFLKK